MKGLAMAYPRNVNPTFSDQVGDQHTLTFIVGDTCDKRCLFCFPVRRKELAKRGGSVLTASVCQKYIYAAANVLGGIGGTSIQGYEPCVDDQTFEITQRILETTHSLDAACAITTSHVNVGDFAEHLLLYRTAIALSIDSATPAVHDASRGKVGAFEEITSGARKAIEVYGDRAAHLISINAVYKPHHEGDVSGIIPLAKEMGLKHVCFIALQECGGIVTTSEQLLNSLRDHRFGEQALDHRISLIVCADDRDAYDKSPIRGMGFVGKEKFRNLSRFTSNGSWDAEGRIAHQAGEHAWNPDEEDIVAFTTRMFREYEQPVLPTPMISQAAEHHHAFL